MIRSKSEMNSKLEIDLTGPEGNAFTLIGKAQALGKKLGWSPETMKDIREDMTEGDYDNLIEVFDKNFGDYVILYR